MDPVAELDAALRLRAVPGRAEQERRYLKSDRVHLGAPVPAVRAAAKAWARAHRPTPEAALALAVRLWSTGVYEHASAGLEVLRTVRLDPSALPVLEDLLRRARTWALVDVIAPELVGPLLVRHPEARPVLDRWVADPDPWVRRAALLADLLELRRGRGDWEGWTRRADRLLDDPSFWIRKAIGWVARDVSKVSPARVVAWLEPRASRLAGLSFREATRALPEAERRRLERARDEARSVPGRTAEARVHSAGQPSE